MILPLHRSSFSEQPSFFFLGATIVFLSRNNHHSSTLRFHFLFHLSSFSPVSTIDYVFIFRPYYLHPYRHSLPLTISLHDYLIWFTSFRSIYLEILILFLGIYTIWFISFRSISLSHIHYFLSLSRGIFPFWFCLTYFHPLISSTHENGR